MPGCTPSANRWHAAGVRRRPSYTVQYSLTWHTSNPALLALGQVILDQLCPTADLHHIYAIPGFGNYQSGLWATTTRNYGDGKYMCLRNEHRLTNVQHILHLQHLIKYLYTSLSGMISRCQRSSKSDELLSVSGACPESPIFSILTEHPRSLAKFCQDGGFLVRAVVPPTVPTRRVRVCLHAGNTVEEIDRLVARVEQWVLRHSKLSSVRGITKTATAQL